LKHNKNSAMIHETKDIKLIDGSAEFFAGNPTIKEMYASEDGQYFFTVSASNHHCKARNLKLFKIARSQVAKPVPQAPPEPPPEAPKTTPQATAPAPPKAPPKAPAAKGKKAQKKPQKPA
jgi:hypothetical protein